MFWAFKDKVRAAKGEVDFEGKLLNREEIGFKIVRRTPLHQRLNFKTLNFGLDMLEFQ